MRILRMRYLRGPNIHAAAPVLEVALETEGLHGDPHLFATMRSRVFNALSEVPDNLAAFDLPGAFAQALIHLQHRAGLRASFRSVRPTSRQNCFTTAVECPEESVGRAAAEIVERLFHDSRSNDVILAPTDVQRLKDLEYQQQLPSSTAVVYDAARRRGIPSRRLSPEYGRLLIHGHGAKQHRSLAAEPDSIGVVARTCSTDKQLAKELMAAAGVPVPMGKAVTTVEDAWRTAQELGLPVAVKPQDSDLQIGVSLDLRNREQVEAAFHAAAAHSGYVLVERFAPGAEHRVLVVDGKIAAVTRIDPPLVVGDGVHTVAELVAEVNRDPRRGDDESGLPWHKLKLDDVALGVLAAQGFDLESVPPAGSRVLVRRNPPYFKSGGNLVDLTDQVHPSIAGHAAAAAQALQLRVAGLDVVALDIREPLEAQRGVVVEINAGPGLWLHLAPWADSPRPVGDAIVASMYPPGDDGRIPVIALVGDGAADFPARTFLQTILGLDGAQVGHASQTQLSVGNRRWPGPACPHERALHLFQFPSVDVAVLETTPDELLRAGFGNDRCDVVVSLASIAPRPNDDEAAIEPEEYLKALHNALVPDGYFITLARDEAAVTRAEVPSSGLFLVADSSSRGRGFRSISVDGEGQVAIAERSGKQTSIGKCPFNLSEPDRQGLLAALAAALVLGIREESLKAYLARCALRLP